MKLAMVIRITITHRHLSAKAEQAPPGGSECPAREGDPAATLHHVEEPLILGPADDERMLGGAPAGR